jgi:hypothetical protein
MRLAQWRVKWLILCSSFYQILVVDDRFVVLNPPLRQARKRYRQFRMTVKLTILLGLLYFIISNSFGQSTLQCDSITVYNGEFDKLFQDEYKSIKADTVLAIRHCGSTNGCYNTFGLLCWKVDGKIYFKKIQRKRSKTKSSIKLDKELKQKLIEFYESKIYLKTGEIEEKNQFWIDDGPLTLLLFKTNNSCWRFGMDYSNSKDIRVIWTNELLNLMRK